MPSAAPRAAEPSPTSISPVISAAVAPKRAISSEPGMAAAARSRVGRVPSVPISVSLRCSSVWMSGMTGGTARSVSRRPRPASHKSAKDDQTEREAETAPAPLFTQILEEFLHLGEEALAFGAGALAAFLLELAQQFLLALGQMHR